MHRWLPSPFQSPPFVQRWQAFRDDMIRGRHATPPIESEKADA
ncbi:MAG: hypothetical protein OJF49_003104 [Ktedonobacterales bacterium]|nr:MAG: hypothetical protein OJF49_003104 [Ktedonobacterales bacterium]